MFPQWVINMEGRKTLVGSCVCSWLQPMWWVSLLVIKRKWLFMWRRLHSSHYKTFFEKRIFLCCGSSFCGSSSFIPFDPIAFLLRLHRLPLPLPSALLCSCSPQRPDHGKCTRPDCNPPQTEWPVGKQAQHSEYVDVRQDSCTMRLFQACFVTKIHSVTASDQIWNPGLSKWRKGIEKKYEMH